jgi:hypothetical protein
MGGAGGDGSLPHKCQPQMSASSITCEADSLRPDYGCNPPPLVSSAEEDSEDSEDSEDADDSKDASYHAHGRADRAGALDKADLQREQMYYKLAGYHAYNRADRAGVEDKRPR